MKAVSLTGFLASLGTCLLLVLQGQQNTTAGANLAVQDPLQSAEVEVQTRGPIHEAFAQATIRRVDAFPVIGKKPPEPIKELPAELRPQGEAVVWVPGYWAFDDDRKDFLWVTGIWRIPPPRHDWVPGYWRAAADGWQWVPGYWAVRGETEVALYPPPPDPIPEAMPPMPEGGDFSAGASYIPGNWVYQHNDYWWQPGFWAPHRVGWIWCPSQYFWTPGGYMYRTGYWDYDLNRRGMLFSPVVFIGQPWMQQNWYYRPRYGVFTEFLLTAMFARVGTNQYYFGDYYNPRYAQLGFRPWMDYRVGGQFYDPMFSYYRWQQRSNPRWEAELRATAQARAAGRMPPLPRTLNELQKLARTDAKANVRIIAEVNQMQAQVGNLEKTNQTQMKQMEKMAQDLQELAKKRAKTEATVKATAKAKAEPGVVKVQLVRPQTLTTKVDGDKAPPSPAQPPVKVRISTKTEGEVETKGKGKGKAGGKVDVDTDVEIRQKGKQKTEPPPKSPKVPQPPKKSGGPPDKSGSLDLPALRSSLAAIYNPIRIQRGTRHPLDEPAKGT